MAKHSAVRIGVDLGGTKIHAVAIDGDGRVVGAARQATQSDQGYRAVLERVGEVARSAADEAGVKWKQVEAIGLGVPGPVDAKRGVILMAPNLGWEPSPVAADLAAIISRPVVLGNDVNFGGLGEATYGCARDQASAFMAFVGTGLGGAFVRKGKVVNGAHGYGGEIGHLPAPFGDAKCGCGRQGCLETTASRGGIARLLREAAARGAKPRIDLGGGLRSSAIRAALDQGCGVTRGAVERCADALAWGLVVVAHVVDPDCFVLGGGVVEGLGGSFLQRVAKSMAAGSALHARSAPDLRLAELGDDAVAVGAAVAAGGR